MSIMEQVHELQQWIGNPVDSMSSTTRVYNFEFDDKTGQPIARQKLPTLNVVPEELGDGDCHRIGQLRKQAGKYLRKTPSLCATTLRRVDSSISKFVHSCRPCTPAPVLATIVELSNEGEENHLEIFENTTVLKLFSTQQWFTQNAEFPELGIPTKFYESRTEHAIPNWSSVLQNLDEFVKYPVPPGCLLKCRVNRLRKGLGRRLFPLYSLHLEHPEFKNTQLMVARKRKKTLGSDYIISCDALSLHRGGNSIVGEVRGNLMGTEFIVSEGDAEILYANDGDGNDKTSSGSKIRSPEELVTIQYKADAHHEIGSRKMKLLVPAMASETKRVQLRKCGAHEMGKCRSPRIHNVMELKNKTPFRDHNSGIFSLHFECGDRGKDLSAKNFQIIHSEHEDYVMLQFGRVSEDEFSLEVRFPMCPLQAFGIALSSITRKVTWS